MHYCFNVTWSSCWKWRNNCAPAKSPHEMVHNGVNTHPDLNSLPNFAKVLPGRTLPIFLLLFICFLSVHQHSKSWKIAVALFWIAAGGSTSSQAIGAKAIFHRILDLGCFPLPATSGNFVIQFLHYFAERDAFFSLHAVSILSEQIFIFRCSSFYPFSRSL